MVCQPACHRSQQPPPAQRAAATCAPSSTRTPGSCRQRAAVRDPAGSAGTPNNKVERNKVKGATPHQLRIPRERAQRRLAPARPASTVVRVVVTSSMLYISSSDTVLMSAHACTDEGLFFPSRSPRAGAAVAVVGRMKFSAAGRFLCVWLKRRRGPARDGHSDATYETVPHLQPPGGAAGACVIAANAAHTVTPLPPPAATLSSTQNDSVGVLDSRHAQVGKAGRR